MKKILSLFVIATMIFAAMSFTVSAKDVTAVDQLAYDGTVNKLTSAIDGQANVVEGEKLVVDLNGFTWSCGGIVVGATGGEVVIYDSSEAKTGKIVSVSGDAFDIGEMTKVSIKDIEVVGGAGNSDALFLATGGDVVVENCTLSAGKAGINADGRNGGTITVIGGKFVNHANPGDRNCAIELRHQEKNHTVMLKGDITFENSTIMMRAEDYDVFLPQYCIKTDDYAVAAYSAVSAVPNRGDYKCSNITYTYTEDRANYKVNISAIGEINNPIGGPAYFYWLGAPTGMALGNIDLSAYKAVVISYGADGSAPLSEQKAYIVDVSDNEIASAQLESNNNGWRTGARSITIPLDSDFSGEIFIKKDNPGHAMAVFSVEFIAADAPVYATPTTASQQTRQGCEACGVLAGVRFLAKVDTTAEGLTGYGMRIAYNGVTKDIDSAVNFATEGNVVTYTVVVTNAPAGAKFAVAPYAKYGDAIALAEAGEYTVE